ncbi:hypothetical protein FTW19_23595 [Terriglobus albidus]|uniref:Alpha-L-rhamnosidase six-hairpin glycosidase domain-containing protein n=1 Tax=Terriglobus albidus TaxID=1592106 RepID=A0A5B9EKV7_9BACT|nr:hypothetical protein [Terriglobus albidus]QEE30716.1 hypothetical protein FTW19_23595 [Terriglobus albidus]
MRRAWITCLGVPLSVLAICIATAQAQQTAASSTTLRFTSSNPSLEKSFAWAVPQALAYSHNMTSDAAEPWYEAALPGRDAFCMRDVSHQARGAAALGLDKANLNMLSRFAAAIAPERDWAGYWEIDKDGKPSTADYVSDEDFWYNLPANFDMLDAIVRMWDWTGDNRYVDQPEMKRFFQKTANEYVAAWDLQTDKLLQRDRIMHRRKAQGKFVDARGIPSYTEGRKDFNLGVDLLAAKYRAFLDLSLLAAHYGQKQQGESYRKIAEETRHLIDEHTWLQDSRHYAGFLSPESKPKGSGDMFLLYFGVLKDSEAKSGALRYLGSQEYLNSIGIEEESYLPDVFFRYGRIDAAYDRIADLTRETRERREYPEVSYGVIDSFVHGLMGIDVSSAAVTTLSRSKGEEEDAIYGVHLLGGTIDVKHVGHRSTTLTNHTEHAIVWRAAFSGPKTNLAVDGKAQASRTTTTEGGEAIRYVLVRVSRGQSLTVNMR